MLAETDSAPTESAKRINRLFVLMRDPAMSLLSNALAVEAISKSSRTSFSPVDLWQLRNAAKSNPQCVQAIAQFCAVPAPYLLDSGADKAIDSQLSLSEAVNDADMRNLAPRAPAVAPEMLESVAAIVDCARESEDLPAVDPKKQQRGPRDSDPSRDES